MEIIADVVNGRVLGSKPADPLGGRVRRRGPADEWPLMPPPTCHRRTARGFPHPGTPALRHSGRPRAQFRPQQKRCRLDVTSLPPCALMKCERRTSDTNTCKAPYRRALGRWSNDLAALDDVRNSSEKLRKSVSSRDSPGFRGHWQPPAVHRLRATAAPPPQPAPGDQLRHGVLVLPQARLSFRGHPSSTGAVPPRLLSRLEASPSRRTREGDRRVPPN